MLRTTLKSAWALALVVVCLPATGLAQELTRDSVWNGVATGAAVGAGLGVVVAKTGDDFCSARDCALALAFVGGWLGHLVDRKTGEPAPVVPGQWVDDSKWNGAAIGAGVSTALLAIDLARRCGTGEGRVQCTTGGTLDDLWKSVLFGAAAGALIDAVIPARAPGGAGSTPAKSRRLSVAFSVRF